MALTPIVTTSATTSGGRNGRAVLDSGGLALAMSLPKQLGGAGDGLTPEDLCALGHSSCFGQAILAVAGKHKVDAQKSRVTCAVTLNKDDTSFALTVELKVQLPGVERELATQIANEAHQICPYSKATRNNVPVTLTVL